MTDILKSATAATSITAKVARDIGIGPAGKETGARMQIRAVKTAQNVIFLIFIVLIFCKVMQLYIVAFLYVFLIFESTIPLIYTEFSLSAAITAPISGVKPNNFTWSL